MATLNDALALVKQNSQVAVYKRLLEAVNDVLGPAAGGRAAMDE